jgi:hypothetical protein
MCLLLASAASANEQEGPDCSNPSKGTVEVLDESTGDVVWSGTESEACELMGEIKGEVCPGSYPHCIIADCTFRGPGGETAPGRCAAGKITGLTWTRYGCYCFKNPDGVAARPSYFIGMLSVLTLVGALTRRRLIA